MFFVLFTSSSHSLVSLKLIIIYVYDCTNKFERDKVDKKQNPDGESFERLADEICTLLPSLYQNLLNKNSRKHRTKDGTMNNNKTDTPDDSSFSTSSSPSSSSSKFSFDKCRSYSSKGPFLFRNLITCGNFYLNLVNGYFYVFSCSDSYLQAGR